MSGLNIMYPGTKSGRFDHDDYRDKHIPVVAGRSEARASLSLYYAVERAIAGAIPGAPSPYVGGCSIYGESMETLLRALGPHA